MSSMRPRLITLFGCVSVMGLSGCGQISFGENMTPDDVGILDVPDLPDQGPIDMDMGEPDVNLPDMDPPDIGPGQCTPIVLSNELPTNWPFTASETGFRTVFWDYATTLPLNSCTTSICHGQDEAPVLGTTANVGSIYGTAASDIWVFLRDENARPDGDLWVHTDAHRTTETPTYSPGTVTFLLDLIEEARACQSASEIATQLAALPLCPPPMPDAGGGGDAGADGGPDAGGDGGDGGPVDTGARDTGTPAECSCEPPVIPIDTSRCQL